jgi:hypothetical protein
MVAVLGALPSRRRMGVRKVFATKHAGETSVVAWL